MAASQIGALLSTYPSLDAGAEGRVLRVHNPRPYRFGASGGGDWYGPRFYVDVATGKAFMWGQNKTAFPPFGVSVGPQFMFGLEGSDGCSLQPFPVSAARGGQGAFTTPSGGGVLAYGLGQCFSYAQNTYGLSALRIDADGQVYAVGTNLSGQWGIADLSAAYGFWTPTVKIPPGFRYLSCGLAHTVLLFADGTVAAAGAMGAAATTYADASGYTTGTIMGFGAPTDVWPAFRVIQTDCVWAHAADAATLVVKADGTLWCTGQNIMGVSGPGDPQTVRFGTGNSHPTRPSGAPQVGFDTWVAAQGGNYKKGYLEPGLLNPAQSTRGALLALRNDGTVWWTGNNYSGRSGNAARASDYITPNMEQVPGLPFITDIAACPSATLALDNTGNVWAWGAGSWQYPGMVGALGAGAAGSQKTPVQILSGVVEIWANVDCGYAVKADGSLWAWGAASMVPTGSCAPQAYPTDTSVRAPTLRGNSKLIGNAPAIVLGINVADTDPL